MHRPTGETVLLYGFKDADRLREIQYVLVQMGIRIKVAKPEQLGQSVGYLVGMKGMEENPSPEECPAFDQEMMVMYNFSINKRIDLMLANIKKRGLAGIPLKCVVTSHNKEWTLYQLSQELVKEHEAIIEGIKDGRIVAAKHEE